MSIMGWYLGEESIAQLVKVIITISSVKLYQIMKILILSHNITSLCIEIACTKHTHPWESILGDEWFVAQYNSHWIHPVDTRLYVFKLKA